MTGSITKRGKNSWRIQVYTGKDKDGKAMRHIETIRGRKGDADKRLRAVLASVDAGSYTPPSKLTVADLLNQWLDGYVKTNCSQRTIESYRSTVSHHLTPTFGEVPLKHLQPAMIQEYYSKALESLSAKSVLYHHRLLKHALKYGVRQGYLGRNPADLVSPPKPRRKPMRALTGSEVTDLLIAAQDCYYYGVIYMAVSTGLRQAELLALRWRDIDLPSRSLSVNRTLYKRGGVLQFLEPKTAHSRRRVAMTSKLAEFLRQHKLECQRVCYQVGTTLTLDDLVFCHADGRPYDASVLSHKFAAMVRKAGLEGVRFHDLRHTFASLMLQRGAKPKVISECLGHASVAFTLDTYSHIIEGMQEEAMALLDEVLPAAANGLTPIHTNSEHYANHQASN